MSKKLTQILNKEVQVGSQSYDDIKDIFNLWLAQEKEDKKRGSEKPLDLHENPLKRCTAPNHLVVDLFGGTGSTLMACEQMGRRCYTIEENPVHVQVIIERYEEYTGEKAKKI